jgi:hypothetical protein
MAIDFNKTYLLLNAVADETINPSQLTELVKISRLIIQSYLINYRSNLIGLITRNGITLNDLSYDCIADAFGRNKDSKFYSLKKFLNSLNHDISRIEKVNLFLAYKSFLIKVTNAQLSKLYSQTDPIGSKILRNIKDAVKEFEGLCITKDLNGLKISLKSSSNENCKPDFPIEKLSLISKGKNRILNTHDLLQNIYDILYEQTEYKKSVSLIDMVSIFKNYFNAHYDYNYEVNEQILLSKFESVDSDVYEILDLKQKVGNFVKEKILINYFLKGKFTKEESEAVFLSLNDIIVDWCSGVITKNTLYDYFNCHYTVTKENYLENIRTKFEYLVKLAREEFANYLLKEI